MLDCCAEHGICASSGHPRGGRVAVATARRAPPARRLRQAPPMNASDAVVRCGYLDGPHGQVHYRTGGAGGRPLLLLHQSPLSSRQFDPAFAPLIRAGRHVLAIDLPGFGQSSPLPEPRRLEDYAAAAVAALDAFGWASADVVGHHTGAVVAAELAGAGPARVRRLVLNGFPLLSPEERAFFRGLDFGPPRLQADGTHLLDAWRKRVKATPGWSSVETMHRHVVDGLGSAASNWMAFPLIVNAELGALLERVAAPTLLYTNTGEDLYAATNRCRALRPDFDYAELQGGTHDIVDEQPAEWVAGLLRFLA
jgi:pimeloyl-ACP methyl ester carboxylesterase